MSTLGPMLNTASLAPLKYGNIQFGRAATLEPSSAAHHTKDRHEKHHHGGEKPADYDEHPDWYKKVQHGDHFHYYRKTTAPKIKRSFWLWRFPHEFWESFWRDLKVLWKCLIRKTGNSRIR